MPSNQDGESNGRTVLAFISYSSVDRQFARQLDASLTSIGVKTFLDSKDIKIGESIPERVYDGLSTSTHLIYIISSSSIQSRWTKEELNIAKMKEKSSGGISILPVLLDEVSLPTSVMHIKYADFRQWHSPNAYRRSFLDLAVALGAELRLFGNDDLAWYSRHSDDVRAATRWLSHVCWEFYGALADSSGHAYRHIMRKAFWDRSIAEPGLVLSREGGVLAQLRSLLRALSSEAVVPERLSTVKTSVEALLSFAGENVKDDDDCRNLRIASQCQRQLNQIVNMLQELRDEVEAVLLAGFPQ